MVVGLPACKDLGGNGSGKEIFRFFDKFLARVLAAEISRPPGLRPRACSRRG